MKNDMDLIKTCSSQSTFYLTNLKNFNAQFQDESLFSSWRYKLGLFLMRKQNGDSDSTPRIPTLG